MNNWFECKIKYDKRTNLTEDTAPVKVSETYLVDAMSFTEVEERIVEEMKPFIGGEFEVSNIRRIKFYEMFQNPAGDRWYRSKVNFVSLDEEKGQEKRTAAAMLIQASTLADALGQLVEGMKSTLQDYEIVSIAETPIADVYFYNLERKAAEIAE